MPDLTLSPAEVNDLIRFSRISIRTILFGSLAHSPDKDTIVNAAYVFEFSPDDTSDHTYATFEVSGKLYFFSIETDEPISKESDDGLPEDGRLMTIGFCEM